MRREVERIKQIYRDYVHAFQSLNPEAILPFYDTPFVSVSSQAVTVLNTFAEIEESFTRNMEILRTSGYVRTDITEINARIMDAGLALVSVHLERYTAEGRQLGGAGKTYAYTYTFRKANHFWKIVSVMAHDPDAILRMD